MMKYLGLFLLLVAVACKSAQTDVPSLEDCPDGGDCQVQILKGTRLLYDENSTEVSFEEDVDFQVVFIQYKSRAKEEYIEEIYLQIPTSFREIHSKNYSLQNQKVTFGKQCNCDDEGFEKVSKGDLQLINYQDYISLDLEFSSRRTHVLKIINLNI